MAALLTLALTAGAALALACGWTARLDAWARRQRVASRAALKLALDIERGEAETDAREAAEDAVRRLRQRLAVAEARWAALDPARAREDGVRAIRALR